jgi:hypothetical protein
MMFDITELCNEKLPQIEKFNCNLPSIGFETSLANSLVHHFLDYVNFCTRCERFMQIFAPTQTFKRFQKLSKSPQKNQMPTNPKKLGQMGFACFRPHEGESERFAFLHNSHEFSDWRKHFHDGKFEHCECITMPTGVHDNILWETIRNHDEVLESVQGVRE